MDNKLDLLLSSVGFGQPTAASTPPPAGNTTRRHNSGWSPDSAQGPRPVRIPSPRRLRQQQNRNGHVNEMLRKERFAGLQSDGKHHLAFDVFSDSIMPKPYMFVTREGAQTVKQKLEIRPSLSMIEYINASLSLIMDSRAYAPADREYILAHIQDVTQEALDRPWEGVRRWSQHVWDQIDNGAFQWADVQKIQNQRFRILTLGGATAGVRPGSHNEQKGGPRKEFICRALNSRSGCRSRSHHDEGAARLMHICSFCDSIGRQCPCHNVLDCDSKLRGPQPRTHYQQQYSQPQQVYRTQAPSDQPWRQPTNSQNQFFQPNFQQQPKNGL